MRFVFYFALSTVLFIISTQFMQTEAVINKPGKTVPSNITKPKTPMNVSKPIRTLPNISKPVSPKIISTIVPPPKIDKIEENNEPMTPENEELEEISLADSEDEAEAKEEMKEEASNEAIIPIKKTKTKSKSSIERLLNNPTVKTLIKTGSVAGGSLLGTIFTVLLMFKLIKAL